MFWIGKMDLNDYVLYVLIFLWSDAYEITA